MNNHKHSHGNATVFIIFGLVIAIIVVLGFLFWKNITGSTTQQAATSDSNASKTVEPISSTTSAATGIDTIKNGSISGNVTYPIEWISSTNRDQGKIYPDDLKVCALDSTTKNSIVCDSGFSKTKQTYTFAITPGSYVIQATTGSTVAYYDLYVKDNPNNQNSFSACAAETSRPIVVTVTSGQVVEKIHAADFWAGHLGC